MPDTTSTSPGPREVLARYQRAMLDKSADDLADLYAVDAVHEFPFLSPGMPARYQGSEEVRAGYRAAWGASPVQPREIHEVAVHESTDPEVITVEQVVTGTVATTGQTFSVPGLLVLRVRMSATTWTGSAWPTPWVDWTPWSPVSATAAEALTSDSFVWKPPGLRRSHEGHRCSPQPDGRLR
ncbi:nuclear transport factor 2 family protein [Kitasatospora sp. NPDC088548]|uniref:nuclear transport factor 2 family protein n=1 Tax=Kitasatospora sp. NPDC088548 TaxID=3364075 RepID=UPI0037F57F1D